MRGGRPVGPGHAGRRARAHGLAYARNALMVLVALVAQVAMLLSYAGTPAFAAATTATATVQHEKPPVFDQIQLELASGSYVAYCAESVNDAPTSGVSYTKSNEAINIPELDYVLYHGYDGKTIKNLTAPSGAVLDERRSRAATQAAAWKAIDYKRIDLFHYREHPDWHSNSGDCAYQAGRLGNELYEDTPYYAGDTDAYQTAVKLLEDADAYAKAGGGGPEAGYAQLWTTTALDSDGINYFQALVLCGDKGASVRLTKTSANESLTTGNHCYELKGATFGLYTDEGCSKLAATLVTDEQGKASCDNVAAGSYWLKETKAPKGYVLDTSVRKVTISGGGSDQLSVSEKPVGAAGIVLQKADAEGAKSSAQRSGTPQGDATLAGAEFKVSYYDGFYGAASKLPEKPTRTWTFASDKGGLVTFDKAHKKGGDELYLDAAGASFLPLGTYAIVETKAPAGYLLSDTGVHLMQVVQDDVSATGASPVNLEGWNCTFTLEPAGGRAVGDRSIRGGVRVGKLDAERGSASPQGDATFKGAEFEITLTSSKDVLVAGTWYRKGQVVSRLVTGADGTAATATDALPYGTYTIRETKAPVGYVLNESWHKTFEVREDGQVYSYAVDGEGVPEQVIRGGVRVGKIDRERNANVAQGDAHLDATFAVTLMSAQDVVVGGATYHTGDVVLELTGDPVTGIAESAADALPYGTYRVSELQPPEGYLPNTSWTHDFSIRTQGTTVDLTNKTDALPDSIVRGGLAVGKIDRELDEHAAQGDATLKGAVFAITLASENGVRVDGSWFNKGDVVKTLTTDAEGRARTEANALPYGTYVVTEVTPPKGYHLNEDWQATVCIRTDGEMIDLDTPEEVLAEQVIRGGVSIDKIDAQNGAQAPQGAATFEGAEFEVVLESAQVVLVNGELHDTGEVVATLVTDAAGHAETPADALPYGTYTIRETKAPEGYLLNSDWRRTFSVREEAEMARYTVDVDPEPELVIRGDLEGVKVAEEGMDRLAGVPFVIRSETTGEWHVVVTDANAELSTASSWNPHTVATNANDAAVVPDGDAYALADEGALDDMAGVWFHGRTDLDTLEVSDDLGALPYDTYRIIEVPCSANEGLEMLDVTVTISRNTHTVNLGTLDDRPKPIPPSVRTTLTDQFGSHAAPADEQVTLVDSVSCYNVVPGTSYVVEGELHVVQEDGSDGGVIATSSTSFDAMSPFQLVEVSFTFDARELQGKDTVAFEKLLVEDEVVASHEDLSDEGQTVSIPRIGTTLTDEAGSHETYAGPDTVLVDVVAYENLVPGKSYDVVGTLMDKQTGEEVVVNGEPVTARKSFVPEEPQGTVEIRFTVDASTLMGKTVVAFESVEHEGRKLAIHADIEDKNQSVDFPRIGTKLTDSQGSHEVAAGPVTLIDEVSYEHLAPGNEYVLRGTLMDRATGEPLVNGEEPVTAEATFVAEEANGTVSVPFEFDASALAGHDLVAFEELWNATGVVARHEDLSDEGQTVRIPEIRTTLEDSQTHEHVALSGETVTLVDTVAYSGLTPGKGYVVSGTLMNKATGEPLLVHSEPVTSSLAFEPEARDGSVELSFTFDASALEGETVVAFERLEREGVEVAVHADIEDKDQTVHFPRIQTTATTEDNSHVACAMGPMTIHDVVVYENLVPGRTYVLTGTLVDKATEKPISTSEGIATATLEFTAEEPTDTVDVVCTLDASELAGHDVVAFEELTLNGALVATHKDPRDEGQTIHFPKIGTTLTDAQKSHKVTAGPVELTDSIAYEGLTPGATYTATGTLMDRETKEPVVVGGKQVQASATFVAKKASGTAEVMFSFDATDLAGHALVAFETLEAEGRVVATHADITDEGQTVEIEKVPDKPSKPEKPSKQPIPQTSDLLFPVVLVMLCGIMAFALGVAMRMRLRPDPNLIHDLRRVARRAPTMHVVGTAPTRRHPRPSQAAASMAHPRASQTAAPTVHPRPSQAATPVRHPRPDQVKSTRRHPRPDQVREV